MIRDAFYFIVENAVLLSGIYVGYRWHGQVGKVLSAIEAVATWAWAKIHPHKAA